MLRAGSQVTPYQQVFGCLGPGKCEHDLKVSKRGVNFPVFSEKKNTSFQDINIVKVAMLSYTIFRQILLRSW